MLGLGVSSLDHSRREEFLAISNIKGTIKVNMVIIKTGIKCEVVNKKIDSYGLYQFFVLIINKKQGLPW
jgi:hypothetical protein